jgi:hypothetical protein
MVWRVRASETIPRIWGAIAGDAIHNLRSSLDVLWRHATNPRPGRPDRRSGAYFPFTRADILEARYTRAEDPAMKRAMRLVLEVKPYQGGDDDLWLLNRAEATDKHETPILVACRLGAPDSRDITPLDEHFSDPIDGDAFYLRATSPITAPTIEDGTELFRFRAQLIDESRAPMDMEMKLLFEIAFGEGGPLEGKLVLPTLLRFTEEVDRVFEAFRVAGLVA